ncbi:MAG: hypothetical protein R3E12_01940 [Candidatus Eisenbacteria bacterium]
MPELAREGRAIARTVQLAMEDYLSTGQIDQAHEFIDRITSYERVLGLRLFQPDGEVLYQSATLDSFPFMHEEELERSLQTRRPAAGAGGSVTDGRCRSCSR